MRGKSQFRDFASAGALLAGGSLLLLAFLLSNIVAALAGIAIAFWGIIILYVSDAGFVSVDAITSTLEGEREVIKQLLANIGAKTEGIHLPPKSIDEVSAERVMIGETSAQASLSSDGALVAHRFAVPDPGLALVRYYQEYSNSDFFGVDFEYLRGTLARLVVEDLNIAQGLDMQMDGNIVTVKVIGRRFYQICASTADETIEKLLGCPLHSSFAVLLARALGKPVVITSVVRTGDAETIAKYRIQ